jgi:hypothetical protein
MVPTTWFRSSDPSRSGRRFAAPALAVALAFGAAGCGVQAGSEVATGSAGASTPAGADVAAPTSDASGGVGAGDRGPMFLRDAGAATAAVTSGQMTMTMTMRGVPMADGDLVMTYEGAYDNVTRQGAFTADLGSFMEGFGGGSTMEMVLDGDTVYVRSGLFDVLGEGGSWVKVTADELATTEQLGVQTDPTGFLDYLEGAGAEVETVGRETLRGVETTHVRTTLDLVALMEEASAEQRAELEAELDAMGSAAEVLQAIPLEAWVDDEGFVRRLVLDFELDGLGAEMGGAEAMTMRIDLELYAFNEPVEITIPDPSEVRDLDDFGSSFGD